MLRLFRWAGILLVCCIFFIRILFTQRPNSGSQGFYQNEHHNRISNITKIPKTFYKAQAQAAYKLFMNKEDHNLELIDELEEVEIDKHLLRQVKKNTPPVKPAVNLELETFITYKIDDSTSDRLEITRCAPNSNPDDTSCYRKPLVSNPPYSLTVWSQDFHVAAVNGLKLFLEPLGVKFIDKNFSPHCALFNDCAGDIRGITSLTAIHLPDEVKHKFHAEYIADREFSSVDAFLCIRPSAMCELFMPFGKSLIVVIDTRFEFGRWSTDRWNLWIHNLLLMSQDPKNVIAATNQYDIEYVRYYTGHGPVLLPPLCPHIIHSYTPKETSNFLLFPIKSLRFKEVFMENYKRMSAAQNYTVTLTRMNQHNFDQAAEALVKFAGIVLIPYQPSSLRMTELYRMNIPIFAPSQELLSRWHVTHGVMQGRTLKAVSRLIPGSAGDKMPGRLSLPNPNDEKLESVGFWMQFIDLYIWPHITYFDSFGDMMTKLEAASTSGILHTTSERMKAYNKETRKSIKVKWNRILEVLQTLRKQSNSHVNN